MSWSDSRGDHARFADVRELSFYCDERCLCDWPLQTCLGVRRSRCPASSSRLHVFRSEPMRLFGLGFEFGLEGSRETIRACDSATGRARQHRWCLTSLRSAWLSGSRCCSQRLRTVPGILDCCTVRALAVSGGDL